MITADPSRLMVRLAGLAVAGALLLGCGPSDDAATATGVTSATLDPASSPTVGSSVPATASAASDSSSGDPAADEAGVTATIAAASAPAGGDAIDTVPESEVVELERTLDEIDRILSDLDTELSQDA